MPTQEQLIQFEDLHKELQDEFPDTLDYILQVLAWKYVIDGTLEPNCSAEELEQIKSKYNNNQRHFKTEVE